ncbi:heterokaryon incompatibility domain-containing protein [Trichoderma velutinum]
MESATLPLRSTMIAPTGQKRRRSESDSSTDQANESHFRRSRRRLDNLSCEVCTLMLSHDGLKSLNSPDGFWHRNQTDCIASADAGCGLCKLILFAVCNEHGEDWAYEQRLLFRNSRVPRSLSTLPNSQQMGIYGLKCGIESDTTKFTVTIQIFAKKDDPIAEIVRQRPLRRNVGSNNAFAAARALIKKCMNPKNPHKHCQYSRDTVLPLRVLDVGQPGDSHPIVKLRINDMDTRAQYLALSYCWGKLLDPTTKPLQLQKNNLEQLVAGIKLESLQQSIQDAIVTTRNLGFRYLWIDALCIIQDCAKDKSTEISRMASIYKNASITIAASSSENAAHGFLTQKIRPYCPGYEVRIPMANNQIGTVYLSTGPYEPDHPLDKRGWTLQEFMLSSRMLIFSDYELLWQCKEMDLRSVSARGIEYLQPLETLPWTVFDNGAEPYFGILESDKRYLWKTIVQQYTDRKLTDAGDKLNAVMGITSELETLWRDINIYGLWKKWFIDLLAWHKPDAEREKRRNLKRAPSWSWASLDGVILYEGSISTEDAVVKSLTIQAAVLTCRILKVSEVKDEKADTIVEGTDLEDFGAELQEMGLGLDDLEYLLLGTAQMGADVEKGKGLLVVDVGGGFYRRIGLVNFNDMKIWEGVNWRDVTFEARISN